MRRRRSAMPSIDGDGIARTRGVIPPGLRPFPIGMLLLMALAMGLGGCAGLRAPLVPQYDSDATQELVTALYAANTDLVAGKWIGKVSMTVDGSRRTFNRAVWAGAEPGRVRFDARTPFGLPALSLACNESYLTAMAHSEGKYYRKRIGSSSLGQIFPVDMSCQDLYRLMIGRPPVIDYHSARLEKAEEEGMLTIRLNRRFKGTVARLWVDAQDRTLAGVELLNIHGKRSYQAWLADSRMVDGFRVPHRLLVESAKGRLEFQTARLRPNRPVAPTLFQIPPPKSSRVID